MTIEMSILERLAFVAGFIIMLTAGLFAIGFGCHLLSCAWTGKG